MSQRYKRIRKIPFHLRLESSKSFVDENGSLVVSHDFFSKHDLSALEPYIYCTEFFPEWFKNLNEYDPDRIRLNKCRWTGITDLWLSQPHDQGRKFLASIYIGNWHPPYLVPLMEKVFEYLIDSGKNYKGHKARYNGEK